MWIWNGERDGWELCSCDDDTVLTIVPRAGGWKPTPALLARADELMDAARQRAA